MNGVAFSAFVTVLCHENTLGQTVLNSWAVILGTSVSSFVCWIVFSCLIVDDNKYRIEMILPLLFSLTAILGHLEIHPLTKKLGLSLLALNLLVKMDDNLNDDYDFLSESRQMCLFWFEDILLGLACALFGCIFPWPRLASDEVEDRARFCTAAIGDLYCDVLASWQSMSVFPRSNAFEIDGAHGYATPQLPRKVNIQLTIGKNGCDHGNVLSSSQWRKFRSLWSCVCAFHKAKNAHNQSRSHQSQSCGSQSVRYEMAAFVDNCNDMMGVRSLEARFGPNRLRAMERYSGFVELIRSLLLLLSVLEEDLAAMDTLRASDPGGRDIFHAFFRRPDFRRGLWGISSNLSRLLRVMSEWVAAPDTACKEADSNLDYAFNALDTALTDFDKEYCKARIDVYYTGHLPHVPEALLRMNSFLFTYCHTRELIANYVFALKSSRLSQVRCQAVRQLLRDMFPSQTALFPTRDASGKFVFSDALRARIRSTFSLAIAMTVGALYGLQRPEPALASFTIAYLSGGAAAGATVITSLNRAMGTVIACVFAVIVSMVVADWTIVSKNVFIGLSVVLFQIPCTYLRSAPVVGYTGTVAGFSSALLLLSPEFGEAQAFNRIIDSYVGAAIFVLVELLVAGQMTENIILCECQRVVSGVEARLKVFVTLFRGLLQRKDDCAFPSSSLCYRSKRTFLVFAAAEPTLFPRPPPLPQSLLTEVLNHLDLCHRCITVMEYAVRASKDQLTQSRIVLAESEVDRMPYGEGWPMAYLLAPLQPQLEAVEAAVSQRCTGIVQALLGLQRGTSARPELPKTASVSARLKCGDRKAEGRDMSSLSEAVGLFQCFGKLVDNLQQTHAASNGERNIMSNLEVEVVCAYMSATRKLLAAMDGLMNAVRRMEDYRMIRGQLTDRIPYQNKKNS